jgi:hypothetical protein
MFQALYLNIVQVVFAGPGSASRVRQIIEDTLLTADIVRAPLKGCFDTPTETLPDHLGFITECVRCEKFP